MSESTIFTEKEAAKAVGCGIRRLADMARAGQVPYFRVGRSRHYTAAQVEQIRALHSHIPAPAPQPRHVIPPGKRRKNNAA